MPSRPGNSGGGKDPKAEPAFRFYVLNDKICREDTLRHAFTLARATSAGVQIVLLLHTQIACAPAHIEAGDASIPRCSKSLRQPRIVSSSRSSAWAAR